MRLSYDLLSGRRSAEPPAQPLVTFTVLANLLAQPLVQLFACGLVFGLSLRVVEVRSSTADENPVLVVEAA